MKAAGARFLILLSSLGLSACPTADEDVCEPECRSGYACSEGACVQAAAASACEPACRSGFTCAAGQCVPAGTAECNPACRSGYECEAGQCIEIEQIDPTPAVQVLDLGTVTFGGEGLGTVFLDVPQGVTSFTVAARTASHTELTSVFRMVDPSGTTIFEFTRADQYALRVNPGEGEADLLFPNTPEISVRTGRYQIELATNADQTASFAVEAVLKRGTAQASGRLDINLFFVGVPELSATSARTDTAFQQVMTRFTQLYAQAGITVGEVHYLDVSAADADRLGVIDTIEGTGNELEQLFALANQYSNDDSFNFYLVRSISAGGGGGLEILGIADGIPGRVSIPDRRRSGVAVTMGYFREDPSSVASTMAHEGGHFLGLFHTSERDGSLHDPLSDTPQCASPADANRDGLLDAAECASTGAQNLMFWLAAPSAVQLSADQTFVLHGNPAIR